MSDRDRHTGRNCPQVLGGGYKNWFYDQTDDWSKNQALEAIARAKNSQNSTTDD